MSYRIADKYDMNGFFLAIEISGLQQFLKIKDSSVFDMLKDCERTINNIMKASEYIEGSFIIYSIDSDIDNSAAIHELSLSVLETVSSYSEELHEFSLMLRYLSNTTAEQFADELKQKYFSIGQDFGLLVENRIAEAAGKTGDDQTVSDYQLFTIEPKIDTGRERLGTEKLLINSEIEKLKSLVVPELECSYSPKRIVLSGDSELIIKINLKEAVEDNAVYIDFLENETDSIMPFFRSVKTEIISDIENNLGGIELNTWKLNYERLLRPNSDYPEEYYFSIYSLYLKGLMIAAEKKLKPQVIIVSGINKGSVKQMNFLKWVISFLEQRFEPVMFFIDTEAPSVKYNFSEDEFFKAAVINECCKRLTPPDGISKLSYHNTRLLFILELTEGFFSKGGIEKYLLETGYSKSEISAGFTELYESGCIIKNNFVKVMRGSHYKDSFERLSEKDDIHRSLSLFIIRNIHNGIIIDYSLAASRLLPFIADDTAGLAVYACLAKILYYVKTSYVHNFLENTAHSMSDLQHDLFSALKLRAYHIEDDKESCVEIMKNLPEKYDSPENIKTAVLMLEAARDYHSTGNYQRALNDVKKVLIFLQAGDYPAEEGAAFIELGLLMLYKNKMLESAEYFSLAVERLAGSHDYFSMMKALFYSAFQQYLWGGFDLSLSFAERAAEIALQNGFEDWRFYIIFFICRLYFEFGRYADAEKMLADCLLDTEIFKNDKRRKILAAWTARACVYQGRVYTGINMLLSLDEDPEVLFFLAEAYYFGKDTEKAIKILESAAAAENYFELGFTPLEHINWKNGFDFLEGRVLRSKNGTGVLMHNVRALNAFLIGMTGNRDYGIEILFNLTRNEKISENDPFNRLYYYFYCQLLEKMQNTDMVDKLTLISKALKYLQQTSSRIKTPKLRQQFMYDNYWNSKLVSEARKEKLL